MDKNYGWTKLVFKESCLLEHWLPQVDQTSLWLKSCSWLSSHMWTRTMDELDLCSKRQHMHACSLWTLASPSRLDKFVAEVLYLIQLFPLNVELNCELPKAEVLQWIWLLGILLCTGSLTSTIVLCPESDPTLPERIKVWLQYSIPPDPVP